MTGLVSAALFVLSLATAALSPPAPPDQVPAAPTASLWPSSRVGPVWPLDPRPEVLREFSPPARAWDAGHRGVDLAASPGQDVRAPLPGRVSFAGMLAGRGVLVVDHGDRRTTYEPVTATVRLGETVAAGTVIGTLQPGPGHCVPLPCLHWGLIAGTEYQDPLGLVQLGPVRLLPLFPDLLRPVGGPSGTRSATARW